MKNLGLLLSLFLTACFMVGPDYKEPMKPVVPHWKEGSRAVNEQAYRDPLWWQVFHDPVLTGLIQQGYHCNLNLQSTGLRVLQARAQLAQSVGEFYPQTQAMTGSYTYNRIGGSSLQDILPSSFDTAVLGFTANWELDFWGKYRRAIRSNNASFFASVAAYDNALVTLTADIATVYIKIRTLEEQIKITKQNIEVQAIGLKIAKSRYSNGQTSLVDVEQAQTEYSQTEANLPSLYASLQKEKDALSVLLGQVPNQLDKTLAKRRGIPRAPNTVSVGIPKEAMVRRPDIYEARMQAIAQSESIGAIKANLYPALSLSGTFAFASNNINGNSISDLFDWSNRTITAGPSFTWPLLNYGQITNAVRAQDAVFQQSLLSYVNVVLKAQQEVQDSITSYLQAKKAAQYLTTANAAAVKTFKLALVRYKEGETDFTPVLNAEQQQLKVQTSLVTAQGDIPQALVNLYRSLGGGWELRHGRDVVPYYLKRQMAARTNWGGLLARQNHLPASSEWEKLKQLYLPTW